MKTSIAVAVLVMSLAGGAAAQEAPVPTNLGPPAEPSVAPTADPSVAPNIAAPPAKTVEFEGCPEKGVEGNCVLIRHGEDVFNITAAEPKVPLNGKGIKLRGEIDPDTVSICFATALKNVTWEQTNLQCPNVSGTEAAPPQNLQVK